MERAWLASWHVCVFRARERGSAEHSLLSVPLRPPCNRHHGTVMHDGHARRAPTFTILLLGLLVIALVRFPPAPSAEATSIHIYTVPRSAPDTRVPSARTLVRGRLAGPPARPLAAPESGRWRAGSGTCGARLCLRSLRRRMRPATRTAQRRPSTSGAGTGSSSGLCDSTTSRTAVELRAAPDGACGTGWARLRVCCMERGGAAARALRHAHAPLILRAGTSCSRPGSCSSCASAA